ncbi:hypothetical protein BDZ89DRAFT_1078560 [Hymenopellis radicata]|nr:hypothetical protein BDZ89DRAFT_1078560 [Hymenopellis radicata]
MGKRGPAYTYGDSRFDRDTEDEENALIEAKRRELDDVVQRHDALVREAFHLDHFRMLLGYDPEEAKKDTSPVFEEYKLKNNYDLPLFSLPSTSTTRRTRRAQKQVLDRLSSTSALVSTPGPSSRPISHLPKKKSKNADANERDERQKTSTTSVSVSHSNSRDSMSCTPSVSEADKKGKGRAIDNSGGWYREGKAILAVQVFDRQAEKSPRHPKSPARPFQVRKRTRDEMEAGESGVSSNRAEGGISPAAKGLLSDQVEVIVRTPTPDLVVYPSSPTRPQREEELFDRALLPPDVNPFISKPTHIPPDVGDLTAFLSSYSDVSFYTAEDEDAHHRAELLEQARTRKIEGRWFPPLPVPSADSDAEEYSYDYLLYDDPTKRVEDIWDHILDGVKIRRKEMLGRDEDEGKWMAWVTFPVAVAAGPCSVVYAEEDEDDLDEDEDEEPEPQPHPIVPLLQPYFQKQEKDRAKEERRVKRGAEKVAKLLRGAWAKVVAHYKRTECPDSDSDDQAEDEDVEGTSEGDEYTSVGDTGTSQGEGEQEEDEDDASIADLLDADTVGFLRCDTVAPSAQERDTSFDLDREGSLDSGSAADIGDILKSDIYAASAMVENASSITRSPLAISLAATSVTEKVPSPLRYPQESSQSPLFTSPVRSEYDSDVAQLILGRESLPSPLFTSSNPELSESPIFTSPPFETYSLADDPCNEDGGDENEAEVNRVARHLRAYAAVPMPPRDPNTSTKISKPALLRATLRPYQQAGLEWLAGLHARGENGVLADEMGLGKTLQTIALLAHLACDHGIWGPHLIIVPTSVLLNWFLPGFKVVAYHGTAPGRAAIRKSFSEKDKDKDDDGFTWRSPFAFNVLITSYSIAIRDFAVLSRKRWYYMVLDEVHMVRNWRAKRWEVLLKLAEGGGAEGIGVGRKREGVRRRLGLTGTLVQNRVEEVWGVLRFLGIGQSVYEPDPPTPASAIETSTHTSAATQATLTRLHAVLAPYVLRRVKRDVEREMPRKWEHIVSVGLSRRQRALYDAFLGRAKQQGDLGDGQYRKLANVLMQLRKVCNHPELFEKREVESPFVLRMGESGWRADEEIRDLLARRRMLNEEEHLTEDLCFLGLVFVSREASHTTVAPYLFPPPPARSMVEVPAPKDTRTIEGFKAYRAYIKRREQHDNETHQAYINEMRLRSRFCVPPVNIRLAPPWHGMVRTYGQRWEDIAEEVERARCILPKAVCPPAELETNISTPAYLVRPLLHLPSPSLLQHDCGKLQMLATLLAKCKAQSPPSRALIFTQMTKVLDILEVWLSSKGYTYLRLDGGTGVEERQYVCERFNRDERVDVFVASSRSGGVGINLTGASTVIFYDSDFNPQMDRQCEDRAHRIGQVRDVHVYRLVSEHTVEEALLKRANQKRTLDALVMKRGRFDWQGVFDNDVDGCDDAEMMQAMASLEDEEDRAAADIAAREEDDMDGMDFGDGGQCQVPSAVQGEDAVNEEDGQEGGGSVAEYMLQFVREDWAYFSAWGVI